MFGHIGMLWGIRMATYAGCPVSVGIQWKMLASLFESKHRKAADKAELDRLKNKYGEDLQVELRTRVERSAHDRRHRDHWKRLLRKAR